MELAVSLAVLTLGCALLFTYVPDAEVRWDDVWLGGFVTADVVVSQPAAGDFANKHISTVRYEPFVVAVGFFGAALAVAAFGAAAFGAAAFAAFASAGFVAFFVFVSSAVVSLGRFRIVVLVATLTSLVRRRAASAHEWFG